MAKINVWKFVLRVFWIILCCEKEKSEDGSTSKKKKAKNSEKSVDIV